MGFPRELVRNLFHSSVSRMDSMPDYLPDNDTLDNVIKNPAIVLTSPLTTTNTRKWSFTRSSISTDSSIIDIDTNSSFNSICRNKTLNEDNNNGGLTVPTEYMKSNSLPDRIPDEQRPSVISRISKQATNHLNNLYYRNVSIESQHSLCGCYFWQKRQSYDSYGVSINANDAAAVSSRILTRHCHRRYRTDTNVSMAFRNESFNPVMEEELTTAGILHTKGNRDFHRSNINSSATERRGNYQHRKYRTATAGGVSDLVSDVIVEEFEDFQAKQPNFTDSHSFSSRRLSNNDDINDEKPKSLLRYERRACSVETIFDIGGESSSVGSMRQTKRHEDITNNINPLFGRNSSDCKLVSSEFLELIDVVRSQHEQAQQNDNIDDNTKNINQLITATTKTELNTTPMIIQKQKSEQNERTLTPHKKLRRRSKSFSSIEDLIYL